MAYRGENDQTLKDRDNQKLGSERETKEKTHDEPIWLRSVCKN